MTWVTMDQLFESDANKEKASPVRVKEQADEWVIKKCNAAVERWSALSRQEIAASHTLHFYGYGEDFSDLFEISFLIRKK